MILTKETFKKLLVEAVTENNKEKLEEISDLLYVQSEKYIDLEKKDSFHEMSIKELLFEMHKGFELMDKRFEAVDKRFEAVDKRFESIDKRFEDLIHYMDKRFDAVDKRFEDMNKKFNFILWLIGFGIALTNIFIALQKFF